MQYLAQCQVSECNIVAVVDQLFCNLLPQRITNLKGESCFDENRTANHSKKRMIILTPGKPDYSKQKIILCNYNFHLICNGAQVMKMNFHPSVHPLTLPPPPSLHWRRTLWRGSMGIWQQRQNSFEFNLWSLEDLIRSNLFLQIVSLYKNCKTEHFSNWDKM